MKNFENYFDKNKVNEFKETKGGPVKQSSASDDEYDKVKGIVSKMNELLGTNKIYLGGIGADDENIYFGVEINMEIDFVMNQETGQLSFDEDSPNKMEILKNVQNNGDYTFPGNKK